MIYFSDEGGNLHTADISSGECEITTLGTMHRVNMGGSIFAPSDIAFHPNGNLYATDGWGLYSINLNTLIAELVGWHNADWIYQINSLVCDSDGTMYAGELQLYTVSISNGSATVIGELPFPTAGDLAFHNGNLYAACANNALLEVNIENPGASITVGTISSDESFFGVVTFATDCSDIQMFATSKEDLYELDVEDASATFVCELINNNFTIFGATMETDFFASDCEFIVDLDFDDSSGAVDFDYIDTICGNTPAPIADLDVDVIIDGVVDSMKIWIASGIQDGPEEQLLLSTANNMQVYGSGTSSLKLVSTGQITEEDLEEALAATFYIDNKINYTPGERQIAVKLYAQNDKESDVATAFIYLTEPIPFSVDLGLDTSMCDGEVLVIDATQTQAEGYEWQDGSTDPILEVTSSGTYSITVTDVCNNTSAASINAIFTTPSSTIELGPDTTLCNDESMVLDVTISEAMNYEWQDGNSSPVMNVNGSGMYAVSVTLDCGIITDDISVIYEEIIDVPLFDNDTLICDGTPIILGANFPNALSYEWQNGENTPLITVTEAGIYSLNVQFHCGELNDVIDVSYIDYVLEVDLGRDTTYCYGEPVVLDVYSPLVTNYRWHDESVNSSLLATEPGSYSVTVSDGCQEVVDVIYLEAESCCNLYMPNVFTPNFDGTNDELNVYSDCEFPSFNFKIFNRWGALVFETMDQKKGWDGVVNGEKANQGVYIWLIEYNDGLKDQLQSGDITLVR